MVIHGGLLTILAKAASGFYDPFNALPAFVSGLNIGGEPWEYSEAAIDADLALVASAGAHSVRIDLHWAAVEAVQGVYDWTKADQMFDSADKRGLIPMMIIQQTPAWARTGGTLWTLPDDPADYATFCMAAVNHYRQRGLRGCHIWQVWNEVGSTYFNTNPLDIAAYVALLQAAYAAIKTLDSNAFVLLSSKVRGGTPAAYETGIVEDTHWLEEVYRLGGGGYFNAVAYHPYCYPDDPADVTPTGADTGDNYLANPGFETNTDGWTPTNCAITRITTDHHSGSACAQLVADGVGQMQVGPPWGVVTPGQVIHFSVWVKSVTTATTMAVQMDWFTEAFGYLSSSYWDLRVCPVGEWVKLGYRAVVPATAYYNGLNIRSDGAVPNGRTVYIDDAQVFLSSSSLHGWNRVPQMRAIMVANGDTAKDIWITEWGQYTGSDTDAVADAVQATYVTSAFARAAALDYVRALYVYSHRDTGTDEGTASENYGIAENDYTPKLSFTAFQEKT